MPWLLALTWRSSPPTSTASGLPARVAELKAHTLERSVEMRTVLAAGHATTVWDVARQLTWSRGFGSLPRFALRLALAETASHNEGWRRVAETKSAGSLNRPLQSRGRNETMNAYSYQEGVLDSLAESMRPVSVRASDGSTVGVITRGAIPGCEATGTFEFAPRTGQNTLMGVRKGTLRTALSRLLRPRYAIVHDNRADEFVELLGENFLYFAVSGALQGRKIKAREDWDGSVEVTSQGVEIGRFHPGGLLAETRVEVAKFMPGSAGFGLMVLLPFIHRIYKDESDALASLFG